MATNIPIPVGSDGNVQSFRFRTSGANDNFTIPLPFNAGYCYVELNPVTTAGNPNTIAEGTLTLSLEREIGNGFQAIQWPNDAGEAQGPIDADSLPYVSQIVEINGQSRLRVNAQGISTGRAVDVFLRTKKRI